MAIAIKSVPTLKGKAASDFNKEAKSAVSRKSSVKFTKELKDASKILAKARLK